MQRGCLFQTGHGSLGWNPHHSWQPPEHQGWVTTVKENLNCCLCPCFYQKWEHEKQRGPNVQRKNGKIFFLKVNTISMYLICKNLGQLHSFASGAWPTRGQVTSVYKLFYSISFKSVNTGINKNLAQLILALTRIFSHNSPPQTLSPCSDSLWTKSPESFCTLETPTRLFTGLFEKGQRSEKAIAYDITIYKSSRSHSTSYCFFWTEHYSVLKGVSSKFV